MPTLGTAVKFKWTHSPSPEECASYILLLQLQNYPNHCTHIQKNILQQNMGILGFTEPRSPLKIY